LLSLAYIEYVYLLNMLRNDVDWFIHLWWVLSIKMYSYFTCHLL